MHVIEIKELYKSFGKIRAVNNLNISVTKGKLFAFLGENSGANQPPS
jgi:ABC-type multidrug transport system ATPase subunit